VDRLDGADAEKPTLVFFANAGREASDFNGLAAHLNAEYYPAEPIEAPDIDGSVPSVEAPILFDMARDARPGPCYAA